MNYTEAIDLLNQAVSTNTPLIQARIKDIKQAINREIERTFDPLRYKLLDLRDEQRRLHNSLDEIYYHHAAVHTLGTTRKLLQQAENYGFGAYLGKFWEALAIFEPIAEQVKKLQLAGPGSVAATSRPVSNSRPDWKRGDNVIRNGAPGDYTTGRIGNVVQCEYKGRILVRVQVEWARDCGCSRLVKTWVKPDTLVPYSDDALAKIKAAQEEAYSKKYSRFK